MAQIKVLLLIENSREAGRGLLRGIARYSRTNGPWIFLKPPPFQGGLIRKKGLLDQLKKSQDVSGIILRDIGDTDKIVASLGMPAIAFSVISEQFHDLPVIITDSPEIGKMGAEHFLERGFRRFAFCGYDKMPWSRQRSESFSKSVSDAGFKTHL